MSHWRVEVVAMGDVIVTRSVLVGVSAVPGCVRSMCS